MKKTPLQKLIDWIDAYLEKYDNAEPTSDEIKRKATELLEEERKSHERTYVDAFVNSDGTRLKVDFYEYFKEMYQQ